MAPFLATWLISLRSRRFSALLFMISAVVASLTDTTLKETAKTAHLSVRSSNHDHPEFVMTGESV